MNSQLTNIYEAGDDVTERNAAALLAACRSMPHLWQLDLSGHHEVFYGVVEPDGVMELVAALPALRRLDLSSNGSCRKYAWEALRRGVRRVLNGRGPGAPPCTVAYGDGLETTVTATVAGECNAVGRRFEREADDGDDGIYEEEFEEFDYDDDDDDE